MPLLPCTVSTSICPRHFLFLFFHLYQRYGPQVDGLGMSGRGGEDDDPGAGDRHARRLHMRRERAVHAAEEESYG